MAFLNYVKVPLERAQFSFIGLKSYGLAAFSLGSRDIGNSATRAGSQ